MPKYKVSLKQGSKNFVEYVETSNLQSLLDFYRQISTSKVVRVEEIVYEDESNDFVVDDGNYWNYCKVLVLNKTSQKIKQYLFHHIKKKYSEKDLIPIFRKYLKVDGGSVDGIINIIMKG